MLPDLRVFIAALFVTVGFVFFGFALMAMLRSAQVTTLATHTPRSPVAASGQFEAQPPAAKTPAVETPASPPSAMQQPATQATENKSPATQPSSADTGAALGATDQIGRLLIADPPMEEGSPADHTQASAVTAQPTEPPGAAANTPPLPSSSTAEDASLQERLSLGSLIETADVTGSVASPPQTIAAATPDRGRDQKAESKQPRSRTAKRAKPAAMKRARPRPRAVATPNAQQGPFSDLFQSQPSASVRPSRE